MNTRRLTQAPFTSPLALGDASAGRVLSRLANIAKCDKATIERYAKRWSGTLRQLETYYLENGRFPNEVRD